MLLLISRPNSATLRKCAALPYPSGLAIAHAITDPGVCGTTTSADIDRDRDYIHDDLVKDKLCFACQGITIPSPTHDSKLSSSKQLFQIPLISLYDVPITV